ncbi:drebrin-like protein B [Cylas formicarius]|uniref:drebrin-like protein B n=1 Tax=Cylas formicarius TaxID=197179 RepID=UPI002958D0F8|nr:drebrin-like protein B [Cylas formicarius]
MTVDLSKNNAALKAAWRDVLDDKTATNWALFGYEGQTNALKVVSTGEAGIDELKDDLNSGKIMYAFVKVNDPKTSLDKYVLIHWQGEGANTVRKGICANHLRDVERFFPGAHLTYTARNEEEIEEELVVDKLKKVGSEYRFKAKVTPMEPAAPVGTVYHKVNAVKEIDSQERDRFWKREEELERKRVEEEKRRRREEILRLETETARREEIDTKKREDEARNRDDEREQQKKAPQKPIRASAVKAGAESPVSDDDSDQFATIKRSPRDVVKDATPQEEKTVVGITEQDFVDEFVYGIDKEGGQKARAIYDYQAADDTEISFDPGDVITNIEKVDDGWWQGLAPDGITYGLFPANYVEPLDE